MATSSHDAPHTPPKQQSAASNTFPGETPISKRFSNQVKQTINTEGVESPSTILKADEVQYRVRTDLAMARIDGAISLVDLVFPDGIAKINANQISQALLLDVLRQGDDWTLWPVSKTIITEPDAAKFINFIGEVVKERFLPHLNPRHCSSMFYEHQISDPEYNYKPDGILLDHALKDKGRDQLGWPKFDEVLEVKPKGKLEDGVAQCSRYSQAIFDAQPGRRFVPAVVIAGSDFALIIFDRSGVIASEKISVHGDPQKLLRLIVGLLFSDGEHIGIEPTIVKKDDQSYITTGGVEYKVECIYHEFGIKGRGTVCYHGKSQGKQPTDVVIKDSWVDVCRDETEVGILNKLNARDEKQLCTPDGVRVIPQIVSHEILKTKRPGNIPGQWIEVDATTAIFRGDLVEKDGDEPKLAWTSFDETKRKQIEIRRLCRIVMKPFGENLYQFTSRKVLVRAFGDITHAIRILHESGIIHRDISFRNILLHNHNGVLRGLLIDYDYAVSIERAATTAIGERTGTLPFLSLDRLREPPLFPHNYFHDLESLFYVMIWTFTFYSGPKKQKRRFSKIQNRYHEMSVAKWNGEVVDGNLSALYSLKLGCLVRMSFWDTLDEFDPYFMGPDLSQCMWVIRDLFFEPEVDYRRNLENFLKTKAKLDGRYDPKETSPEKKLLTSGGYNRIPISMRPPSVVFGSLLAILEETTKLFPEEEVVIKDNISEKGDDTEVAGDPRRVREALYGKDDVVMPEVKPENKGGDEAVEVTNPPLPSRSRVSAVMESMTHSSTPSRKRKSFEDSVGSSKRSRSLITPGNSMSGAISGLKPFPSKGKANGNAHRKPQIVETSFKEPLPKGNVSSIIGQPRDDNPFLNDST